MLFSWNETSEKLGLLHSLRKQVLFTAFKKVSHYNVARTDTIKDLGVHFGSKPHFHIHADYIFSQSLRMLGLIRAITSSFYNLDWILMLYLTIVRQRECVSVIWNSITFAGVKNLERIQRKCENRFFPSWPCHLGGFS